MIYMILRKKNKCRELGKIRKQISSKNKEQDKTLEK